ncbi:Co2+/Mg2+ efflux protein ApaG [Sphingomonas sp. AP4-R1]|uniref:Co2+/Mg2+ efflux protein ApaG n=1 Tax=Sphingomonas sp. AP4-R1 TaxID=2735134 RepID=UPI001493BB62|nr:Co2+/Mg2+ efflux protein ApaG [Sphingomonas sp. AP4-R1]QJU60798.1 Co2+/Mg2+ efflux protein ApaG [Sphingomonas sp. AP4-R1]
MLTDLLFPYVEETQGVIVRVSVSFLADQSQPERGRWFWSYHIRIENAGDQPVQLVSRRWIITDGHGARHRVEGEGVVGAQPLIAVGESYDYVSGCPLDTPTGSMEGSYKMIRADGDVFDARIPRFALVGTAVD